MHLSINAVSFPIFLLLRLSFSDLSLYAIRLKKKIFLQDFVMLCKLSFIAILVSNHIFPTRIWLTFRLTYSVHCSSFLRTNSELNPYTSTYSFPTWFSNSAVFRLRLSRAIASTGESFCFPLKRQSILLLITPTRLDDLRDFFPNNDVSLDQHLFSSWFYRDTL